MRCLSLVWQKNDLMEDKTRLNLTQLVADKNHRQVLFFLVSKINYNIYISESSRSIVSATS
jgi:predicted transcriptional regulator with HTH domain